MAKVKLEKKYWQANRDKVCKGSGVGNALDVWQNCCPTTNNIRVGKDYDSAYNAITNLTKKLGVAKQKASSGKASKSKTETLEMIKEFEKKIGSYKTALDKQHSKWLAGRHLADSDTVAYKKKVKAFVQRRQKLLAYVQKSYEYTDWRHAHLKQVNDELDARMTQLEKAIDNVDAITAQETVQAMKKYYQHAQKTMREIQTKYDKDGPYIKKERGGEASADSMGVLPKDAAPYEKIFIEVTKITNDTSRKLKDSKDRLKTAERMVARAEKLAAAGKKTEQQALEATKTLEGRASEFKEILDDSERRSLQQVERIAVVAKKLPKLGEAELRTSQSATDSYMTNLRKFSKQFSTNLKQVRRTFELLDKRVPKAMRKNKTVAGRLKSVAGIVKDYTKKEKSLTKQSASAEKLYQKIQKAKPNKVAVKNK